MNRVNRRLTTDGWMNIWMPREEADDVARVTRAMPGMVTSRINCFSYGARAASVCASNRRTGYVRSIPSFPREA